MRVYLLGLAFVFVWSSPAQDFGSEDLGPYIPSPQIVVERMLEAARIKPGEMVYDLGSGDGRIVITAAQKFKANAVGIEISEVLCKSTLKKVNALGLASQVRIIHGNALKVDLSPADVVTLYLLTSSNVRLKPNLEKYLKPGARVVSLNFGMPGWKAARVETVTRREPVKRSLLVGIVAGIAVLVAGGFASLCGLTGNDTALGHHWRWREKFESEDRS
jgi:ubiquinone/menaquinone biosynthesis C-methylase UbiE